MENPNFGFLSFSMAEILKMAIYTQFLTVNMFTCYKDIHSN